MHSAMPPVALQTSTRGVRATGTVFACSEVSVAQADVSVILSVVGGSVVASEDLVPLEFGYELRRTVCFFSLLWRFSLCTN